MCRLHHTRHLVWLVAVLLTLSSWPVGAANYRYDLVHSQILFSVDHDGYSHPFGRLHIARGWLRFDPHDWSTAATELDIDMAGVDMGDADWNKAVCKHALLDCADHPYAHFVSTRVERQDDHHGVLHGVLTLRGITQKISLPFTFNRDAMTIYGMHTVAGFSSTTTLDRREFGSTAFAGSIGRQVRIWLELEAIRDETQSNTSREQP